MRSHSPIAVVLRRRNGRGVQIQAWTPLRPRKIGALVGFNVESEDHDLQTAEEVAAIVSETLHSITEAGRFGVENSTAEDVASGDSRTWVRIKLTGLLNDSTALARISDAVVKARTNNRAILFPGIVEDGDWNCLATPGKLNITATVSNSHDRTTIVPLSSPATAPIASAPVRRTEGQTGT